MVNSKMSEYLGCNSLFYILQLDLLTCVLVMAEVEDPVVMKVCTVDSVYKMLLILFFACSIGALSEL